MSQNGQNDAPLVGAALMMGFVIFGPLIDMFAKLAAATMPVGQIAVTRLFVQGMILVPITLLLGRWYWPDLREWGLHMLRGALILASAGFIAAAVRFMPIADAIAIFFVEPMFLMLLGAVLLGESIGPRRMIACVVGFIGAMLVIQPHFENFCRPIPQSGPWPWGLLCWVSLPIAGFMSCRSNRPWVQKFGGWWAAAWRRLLVICFCLMH